MRAAIACLGLGAIASGAAIITVVYRNGEDQAALAAAATIGAGCVLFLASRAFKPRERA